MPLLLLLLKVMSIRNKDSRKYTIFLLFIVCCCLLDKIDIDLIGCISVCVALESPRNVFNKSTLGYLKVKFYVRAIILLFS